MAFLCPVRIRRNKKKKEDDDSNIPQLGRITGSSSIETLVRVGLEKEGLSPEARMMVLHDFTPCVDDELEVKRGMIVFLLYREHDWAYVLDEKKHNEGFIPESYIAPFKATEKESSRSKKINRETTQVTSTLSMSSTTTPSSTHSQHQQPQPQQQQQLQEQPSPVDSIPSEVHPFYKDPSGRYVVLYTFIARDENDITVQRGEMVTVLNRDDPDWFWIVRTDGQEGFVPSAFIYPPNQISEGIASKEEENKEQVIMNGNTIIGNGNVPPEIPPQPVGNGKLGAELVMLYDYKAQVDDDLSVRRGDWVYADLTNQTVEGWLWAYAPKQRKSGFIPKAYARPPAMTSL